MGTAVAALAHDGPAEDESTEPAALLGLDALRGASLAEVDAAASLQHRVDRKYLVPAATAVHLVAALARTHHVLDLGGRRTTGYRTAYFDTAGLASWRAHAQGRRRRWKVRTRLYTEDGLCRAEVKTKDGRGATVKHAHPLAPDAHGSLDGAVSFVDGVLAASGVPWTVADLSPAGEVAYVRAALADLGAGTRVTFDGRLVCHRGDRTTALDPGFVLVETKGGTRPAAADRLLLRAGSRPVSFSKYLVGMAQLVPRLPDNDIRRVTRDRFTTGPRTSVTGPLETRSQTRTLTG